MKFSGKVLAFILLAVLMTASASAQQSQNSSSVDPGLIPGDFFYPVESFVEDLEASIAGFVGGKNFKAKAVANNAEEKLAEAEELAERNRSEKAAEMTQKYSEEINRSREMAEKNGNRDLSSKIGNISEKNVEKLEKIKRQVPEQAKDRVNKAINKSRQKGRSQSLKEPENRKNPGKDSENPLKNESIPGKGSEGKSQDQELENLTEKGNRSGRGDNLNESLDVRPSEENKSARPDVPGSSFDNSSGGSDGSENEEGSENPLDEAGKGLL